MPAPFYRVVTRLETEALHAHENSYYVARERLADFLAEVSLAASAESFGTSNPVCVRLGKADSVPSKRKQRGSHIGRPVRIVRSRMITNEGGS